ncbi:MAG: glycoside hydrolase family 57 protein [Candidatus Omnitrophica bacterium]|nr:glycoside hydrolase family 57 protein [Candidatus Omnitrophota bacterium]
MPWVRLHGTKDYLDMVKILENYPLIHQTFNLVPSLVEQLESYLNENPKDKFLELSYKYAEELTEEERRFLLERFFMIDKQRVISIFPRYYELYLKKKKKLAFNTQDLLDLQVWFNLAWIDPYFRQEIPELYNLIKKARFFTEEEKRIVLETQRDILRKIIPTYKELMAKGQIEITISPYYHPILPLIYNIKVALEAEPKAILPKVDFSYPEDVKAQIEEAIRFYKDRFGKEPQGMWPSEESVSQHILDYIIQAGINWIVTDEGILFKSLKKKKRDTQLLYQPYILKRKEGNLNIIFRDRNLSDLISFVYYNWDTKQAVDNFMFHIQNIVSAFKDKDVLLTVAMDGENAWEYYLNDGHYFLESLYERLSNTSFVKCVTVSEYLKMFPPHLEIKRLSAGSWIYANFSKWIGNPYKNCAWKTLAEARRHLNQDLNLDENTLQLAKKQIYIAEGSDWFWWYGEDHSDFDALFRMHLINFYKIIKKEIPAYLKIPLKES